MSNSSAAQHLKSEDWGKVLPEVTKAYGAISSPPAADALQASLTSISMSVDENVYTFMDRFQSLLANIHITFEAIEEVPQAERLSFAQVQYISRAYIQQLSGTLRIQIILHSLIT